MKNLSSFFILISSLFINSFLVAQNINSQKKSFQKPHAYSIVTTHDTAVSSSTTAFSNTNLTPISSKEEMSRNNSVQTQDSILKRIKNIDLHINTINAKIDYVNSDELKKAKAEKDGWFIQMQRIKDDLLREKMNLTNKLSTNKY